MSDYIDTPIHPALRSRRVGGPDLLAAGGAGPSTPGYGPKDAPTGPPVTTPSVPILPPATPTAPSFLPGDQASREQMGQYYQQILGGRDPWGSIGNFYTGPNGSINPSALPQFYQSQLEQTNVDDSGQGVWNFGTGGTGGITLRDGRTNMVPLGDSKGQWDHRYIKDWSLVTYDPEVGPVTPQSNIQAQQDASMRNFGLGLAAIATAGIGSQFIGPAAAAAGETAPALEGAAPGLLPNLTAPGTLPEILDGSSLLGGNLPELIPPLPTLPDLPALADTFTQPINDFIGQGLMPPTDTPFDVNLPDPFNGNGPYIPPTPNIPGSNGGSFLDRAGNYVLDHPGTALTAAGLLAQRRGPEQVPSNLNAQRDSTVAGNQPIIDQARSILMSNGRPTSEQRTAIDSGINRQVKEAVEALKQRAVNSGMGADSMVTQDAINKVTENAEGLRQQMYMQQAQQNISNAISEWGEANKQDIAIQSMVAQIEMQNSHDSQALNTSIAQSIAWLVAMGNSRGNG